MTTHPNGPQPNGSGAFTFAFDLNQNILVRKSHSEYPKTDNKPAVKHDDLMVVQGELQSELGVIHVIAAKVRDYSHWLGRVQAGSRDFR